MKRSAEKKLKAIPSGNLKRVVDRIRSLAQQPRSSGCEKLSGECERYRIVYGIEDAAHVVEVVKIGHRREVYRETRQSVKWRSCGLLKLNEVRPSAQPA